MATPTMLKAFAGAPPPNAGLGGCRQLACIDVLVSLGAKPLRTDSEKDEVLVTYIGNTLAAAGWNEYDISGADDLGARYQLPPYPCQKKARTARLFGRVGATS